MAKLLAEGDTLTYWEIIWSERDLKDILEKTFDEGLNCSLGWRENNLLLDFILLYPLKLG